MPATGRARLGAVSFLHRFGTALNHHVHLHACATDGAFVPTGDGPPAFRPARLTTQADLATLTEKVRCRVVRWFRMQRLLDADAAADMLARENSGFSVDASVRITLIDRDVPSYFKSLEHLLRYCTRPPFALERLSVGCGEDRRISRVRYVLPRHKAANRDGSGGRGVSAGVPGVWWRHPTHRVPRSGRIQPDQLRRLLLTICPARPTLAEVSLADLSFSDGWPPNSRLPDSGGRSRPQSNQRGAAATITAIPTTFQKSRRVAATMFRWILPTRPPMATDGTIGPPGRSPRGLFGLRAQLELAAALHRCDRTTGGLCG